MEFITHSHEETEAAGAALGRQGIGGVIGLTVADQKNSHADMYLREKIMKRGAGPGPGFPSQYTPGECNLQGRKGAPEPRRKAGIRGGKTAGKTGEGCGKGENCGILPERKKQEGSI